MFAGIERAHLEIAYDNGGINRYRTEERAKAELHRFLATVPYESGQLQDIDRWLLGLSEEQLETVCAGEHFDQLAAMKDAPPFTHDLLNEIFDHVC